MLPSPSGSGLGLRDFHRSRPPRVRFRYGLVTRSPPQRVALSAGFRNLGFPPLCRSSYGDLALSPVGLTPTERVHVILDALPDGRVSRVRLEADAPLGQPLPSRSSPACPRVSQQFAVAFGSHRLPALPWRGHSPSQSGHSRRLAPFRFPRRPEALRSPSLLSPGSSLLRPHAPVSHPPTHFPGSPVIA
jgi:hypothetical protein